MICPALLIAKAVLVLPAVILKPVGEPVVANTAPTLVPLAEFSAMVLVCVSMPTFASTMVWTFSLLSASASVAALILTLIAAKLAVVTPVIPAAV